MYTISPMFTVYILRCKDNSLYTGYTNDLARRLARHHAKTASKYTASHGPVRLCYQEPFRTKSEALKREYEIKQLSKQQKESLVAQWRAI